MDALDICFSQVIPAQPGYYVVSTLGGPDDFPTVVHRDPVIAWALKEGDQVPFPITVDGTQIGYSAIERPDGQVDSACSRWYPNAVAWLASRQRDFADAHNIDAEDLAAMRGTLRRADFKISHTMPAQPGYAVLGVIDGYGAGDVAEVWRLSILGWAFEAGSEVPDLPYPITLEGVKEDVAIEHPDGRVQHPFGAWNNAAEWLEEQLSQRAKPRTELCK